MGFLRYLVTESWAFLHVWWWRVAVLVGIAASNALSASRASAWGYFFAFHLLTALWAYDLGRDVAKRRSQDRIDRLHRMYHSLEEMEPAVRRVSAIPPTDPLPRPGPGRKRGEWA
jgi:hypothetical protein